MSEPVSVGKARKRQRPKAVRPPQPAPRLATGDEPEVHDDPMPGYSFDATPPLGAEPPPSRSVNPYAPVGWQAKERIEFDLELPSGQVCRVIRMERDDLFRLNLQDYLNSFLPLLMDDALTDEQRELKMAEIMQDDPKALTKMLGAIDQVVMAACVKPRITEDPEKVNIGGPAEWNDANFVAVVPLDNIPTVERMFIFGSAFGRSMDDLKSLLREAEGMAGMGDVASLQQDAQ